MYKNKTVMSIAQEDCGYEMMIRMESWSVPTSITNPTALGPKLCEAEVH